MSLIETVARDLAKADETPEDEWKAYEELAIIAIKSVKEWFDTKKRQGELAI